MFNQRCEFFIVKRRVDRLTYKLKLSTHWRVYSIIFITQLNFFFEKNSYNRFKFDYSNVVEMKKNTNDWRFYVMKRILNKRIRKFERIIVIQYIIKWFDWKLEYNEWRFFFYLNNCLKLIEKYEKRQRTKFFVVVVSVKKKSITLITFVINDASIIVVVSKRERERFKKISIKTWLQKFFAINKNLQHLNLIIKHEHEEILIWLLKQKIIDIRYYYDWKIITNMSMKTLIFFFVVTCCYEHKS